jgi:hypothetical protein
VLRHSAEGIHTFSSASVHTLIQKINGWGLNSNEQGLMKGTEEGVQRALMSKDSVKVITEEGLQNIRTKSEHIARPGIRSHS